jgi:hypothetical protein
MPYISQILDRCDILFKQEHSLSERQLSICGDINPNFMYFAVSGFGNEKVLTVVVQFWYANHLMFGLLDMSARSTASTMSYCCDGWSWASV